MKKNYRIKKSEDIEKVLKKIIDDKITYDDHIGQKTEQ